MRREEQRTARWRRDDQQRDQGTSQRLKCLLARPRPSSEHERHLVRRVAFSSRAYLRLVLNSHLSLERVLCLLSDVVSGKRRIDEVGDVDVLWCDTSHDERLPRRLARHIAIARRMLRRNEAAHQQIQAGLCEPTRILGVRRRMLLRRHRCVQLLERLSLRPEVLGELFELHREMTGRVALLDLQRRPLAQTGSAARRREMAEELRVIESLTLQSPAMLLRQFRRMAAWRQRLENEKRRLLSMDIRFVAQVAQSSVTAQFDLQAAIEAGNRGLLRAVARFDHSQPVRFSTFALWWVRQSIMQAKGLQTGRSEMPCFPPPKTGIGFGAGLCP